MLSPDWQDAQVHTVVLSQSMGYDIDGGYINQQVYLIEFPYVCEWLHTAQTRSI